MTACEARQVWGKVFNKLGINDTKSQIRYLRQQLKELGMPSRMSMEAAKKIGSRRALEKEARELGIDLDDEAGPSKNSHESEEETETRTVTTRPKRAAALKRPPPKQRIRIDSEDDLEEEAEEADSDSESESEDSDADGQKAGDGNDDVSSSSSDSSSQAETDDDDDGVKPSKLKSKVCAPRFKKETCTNAK